MNTYIGGGLYDYSVTGDSYLQWLDSITNGGTSYPTSFTSTQQTGYDLFINDFLNENNGYSSDKIETGLNPTAMFNLISNSPCAH